MNFNISNNIKFDILALTIYMGKPIFVSTSKFLALEDEPFVLQCIVNVTLGANYELLFLLPNKEVAETVIIQINHTLIY